MIYVRGSVQDYDDWAALTGDEGWSAEHMQQYMRKHQVTLHQGSPALKLIMSFARHLTLSTQPWTDRLCLL